MFMGMDGFVWFTGVVEDRDDPLKLGRVRVRCLGIHPEDKTLVPTASLPWAHPMQPITSAAMNGIGQTPLGVVEGTWVVGFFRDGIEAQDPVIMGTVGGIPAKVSVKGSTLGFRDPSNTYPLSDKINEPDTNRRARNENVTKRTDQETHSTGNSTWKEPSDPFAAVYPKNHVHESESGHISEVDDTPGAERLMNFHKTGTFEEIHPDGSVVTKIVGSNYTIIADDENVRIKGTCNVTIDNTCNMKMKNLNIEVENDMSVTVGGKLTEKVGSLKTDVSGSVDENFGSQTTTAFGTVNIQGTSVIVSDGFLGDDPF